MKKNLKLLGHCFALGGVVLLFIVLGLLCKYTVIPLSVQVMLFLKNNPALLFTVAIVVVLLFSITVWYAFKEDK